MRAKRIQAIVDILIATVDLGDIAYLARAFGRHGRQQQSNARTDVGRQHTVGLQSVFVVKTDHDSTVRIAQHYLCTHIDQTVDEEQTALEHLLMYQHRAATLRGHYEHHRQQVGRQPRHGASAIFSIEPSSAVSIS